MVAGDFNAHPSDEPRYCGATKELKVFDSRFANLFDTIYQDFAGITGTYFTYRSPVGSLTRLDRCLCSLPTVDLMDRRPTSHTTIDIAVGEWISDHSLVVFCLTPSSRAPVVLVLFLIRSASTSRSSSVPTHWWGIYGCQ